MTASFLLHLISAALAFPGIASALAATPSRSYLITGANKGQGYALCERILSEHPDSSHIFLCSRDYERGLEAKAALVAEMFTLHGVVDDNDVMERIDVVQLDVTDDSSVNEAVSKVTSTLEKKQLKLHGVVSNAGILWGYPLPELIDVCATGVRRVLDAFVPLVDEDDGRVVVVTSGLGPLMHGYAGEHRRKAMMDENCSWDKTLVPMINECIQAYQSSDTIQDRMEAFEKIAFPGGPFAESAPDFHMYGLAKMFGDAYMLSLARKFPRLRVTSVDPGLVYTDLILKMPRYSGKVIGETTAQTPKEGVEATMRLLFDKEAGKGEASGKLYAMSKDKTELVFSSIDIMPQKQE